MVVVARARRVVESFMVMVLVCVGVAVVVMKKMGEWLRLGLGLVMSRDDAHTVT